MRLRSTRHVGDRGGVGGQKNMAIETEARWVPIAVSCDILDGTVIPARLPTGPIAVWRSASGSLYANGDRCPHRGMRLSQGFVRGETLSCIYHGWRFGADGACQKIPAHPKVSPPKTINCGPLPVTEANGVVWGAATSPVDAPDQFVGHDALRSLVVAASTDAIASACEGEWVGEAIAVTLGGQNTILLLNPYGPAEVLVIALVPRGLTAPDLVRVSTALEALRRSAEAVGEAA
mgnify:CR=1 FL=1